MRNREIGMTMRVLVAVMVLGGMAGTSHAGLFGTDETPGERFRKAMEKIRLSCEGRKLALGEVCGEVAKLKPADPLATEEGRFAHSIKIPNPLPEDSGYKPGMTSQEYFDHLCKTEAGEFIYRMVENVEGLYMMRPRKEATDNELEHLYALEDPYGHTNGEATMGEYDFVSPNRYLYLERRTQPSRSALNSAGTGAEKSPAQVSEEYERLSGYDGRHLESMHKEKEDALKSQYGFTWRGLTRPHDRELGIAGGELIVLDLKTKDVLGVRRGYIRTGAVRNNLTGVWWLTGKTCPRYGYRDGRNKDFDLSYWFIGKVLRSRNYEQSFKELIHGE